MTKTVYVLGAGASFEFGLPVGETLKDQICSLFNYKDGITSGDTLSHDALGMAAHLEKLEFIHFLNAAKLINHALPLALSIDNFIHNHADNKYIELCGKVGIVRSILEAEANSKLRVRSHRDSIQFSQSSKTWAVKFVQLLTEQCRLEELPKRLSRVAFIVFNYDRCLEHFLLNAIMASYNIGIDQAADIVNSIRIYHPYGVVGALPWMTNHNGDFIAFGDKPDAGKLVQLSKGIKTFTEGTDPRNSEIMAIRSCLLEFPRRVFLGFAYHPLNMELMLGESRLERGTVFGTALGMSDSDVELVRQSLDYNQSYPRVTLRNDASCVDLFHEYSRSLGFNNKD